MPISLTRPHERAKKIHRLGLNGTLLNDTDAVVFCVNAILAKVNHAPITAEFFRDIFLHPIDQFYRSVGLNEEELRQILDLERDGFTITITQWRSRLPCIKGPRKFCKPLNTTMYRA